MCLRGAHVQSTVTEHGTYRVLSLDGGGVRGFFSALLVARLTAARPRWLAGIDFVAGTSTGAIIALSLAMGMEPRQIAEIYERESNRIFSASLGDHLLDAGGLIGPRYSIRRLAAVLRHVFRDVRLADLGKRILVPAFDLDDQNPDPLRRRWKPKLFHNFPVAGNDGDMLARRVALYSSAVPTVFASVDGYVDGGVYAANPSLCAVAQSLDACMATPPPELNQLHVLSIGTGKNPLHIAGDSLHWGIAQWAKPLLGMVLDAGVSVIDYQCEQLMGPRYHRLNPWLDGEPVLLDDAEALPRLRAAAERSDIDSTVEWLDQFWLD